VRNRAKNLFALVHRAQILPKIKTEKSICLGRCRISCLFHKQSFDSGSDISSDSLAPEPTPDHGGP